MQAVSVRVTLRFLIAACLSIGMVSAGAEPSKWNAIGTLECTAGASLGLAGGGRQRARCSFNTEKLTANYTGRFERVDRLAGIPSGSNCGGPYWHQRAVASRDLSGRYQSGEAPQLEQHWAAPLCLGSPHSICLSATQVAAEKKLNFATMVLTFRFERYRPPVRAKKQSR